MQPSLDHRAELDQDLCRWPAVQSAIANTLEPAPVNHRSGHHQKRRHPSLGVVAFLLVLAGSASVANAQWRTQQVELRQGWNSVYLTVDPEPREADLLFAGDGSIEMVWAHSNAPLNPTVPNCPQPSNPDPDCPAPDVRHWQSWVPNTNSANFLNSLRVIEGGRVYQIKASSATTLSITGKPHSKKANWRAGLNLVGFHVASNQRQLTPIDDADLQPVPNNQNTGNNDQPTELDNDAIGNLPGNVIDSAISFAEYLAPSTAHSTVRVYQWWPDGDWLEVNPASDIVYGEGYWVTATSASNYDGPIDIDRSSLRGIDYGQLLNEHPLTLINQDDSGNATVTIERVASAQPPTNPSLAGNVPVRWLDYGAGSERETVYQWYDLHRDSWELGPKNDASGKLVLRLATQRAGLSTATVNANGAGSQYQGLLRISNNQGYERFIPMALQQGPSQGLWVGEVEINQMAFTNVGGDGDATTPRPTAQPFTFRVILHDSKSGGVKLLNDVVLMATTTTGDTDVLVTQDIDPVFKDSLVSASLQNGEPFTPRISTAAYALDADLLLTGMIGNDVSGSITVGTDNPLNPFYHKFHPDHNSGSDVYEVARSFNMNFSQAEPEDFVGTGYGSDVWGGTWTESITGLLNTTNNGMPLGTIEVEGNFLIYRISQIGELNQALPGGS